MVKSKQSRHKFKNQKGRNDRDSDAGFDQSKSNARSSGPKNQSWLFGNHAVYAAINNPQRTCHRLLVTAEARKDVDPILAHAASEGLSRPAPEVVDRGTINQTLPEGAVNQGIAMEVAPLPALELEDLCKDLSGRDQALVVIIDQGTDPRNIGAVMRSACAFGASAVVVQDRNAPEATGTMAKAASGALETLPLIRVINLSRSMELLNGAGFWSVGLAGESDVPLQSMEWPDKTALILGSEGKGMRRLVQENCDFVTKIPMTDDMESLNLSNAAAIALYEIFRKRQ